MSNFPLQLPHSALYACNLRTHFKTHTEEKSNKCNQCDFASHQASNLRKHLKVHSGDTVQTLEAKFLILLPAEASLRLIPRRVVS